MPESLLGNRQGEGQAIQSQPGEEATWAESGWAMGAGLPKSHQGCEDEPEL